MDKIIFILGCTAFAWVLTNYIERASEVLNKPKIMQYVCLKCYAFIFGLITGCIVFGWWGVLYGSLSGLFGILLDNYLTEKNL